MSPTLTMPTQFEYRNDVQVHPGGIERRVYGAKRRIERQQHDLVVAATDSVSVRVEAQHVDWRYDLRRGQLRIYGSLLRFIDLLHRRGFSKETALMIPSWLADYIHDVWETERAA